MAHCKTPRAAGFTLVELMIVVTILAVLAVVAVPAYIKHMRRAKTAEAIDNIDKIYKSAAAYYTIPRVAQGGVFLPCPGVDALDLTPDVTNKACCGGPIDTDQDDRCDVDLNVWNHPGWSTLNFEMKDQHYFGYFFEDMPVGPTTARIVAGAMADLDCDADLSTFARFGTLTQEGANNGCKLEGSSAFFAFAPTE